MKLDNRKSNNMKLDNRKSNRQQEVPQLKQEVIQNT